LALFDVDSAPDRKRGQHVAHLLDRCLLKCPRGPRASLKVPLIRTIFCYCSHLLSPVYLETEQRVAPPTHAEASGEG